MAQVEGLERGRDKQRSCRNFRVCRLSPGDTFDLSNRLTDDLHSGCVVDGVLSEAHRA